MRFRLIREASLHQRLLLLTVVTSGIGVLLGCIGFLAYDMHVARQEKMQELRSTGDLVGMNSTAALEFGDEIAGAKLLESLSTRFSAASRLSISSSIGRQSRESKAGDAPAREAGAPSHSRRQREGSV
jgi:hypothetical protein